MHTPKRLLIGTLLTLAAGSLLAQASGLTRTIVGRGDVSVTGREAVVAERENIKPPFVRVPMAGDRDWRKKSYFFASGKKSCSPLIL